MTGVLIVGGGIVGMVAAHLLQSRGERVILAEASSTLGGLLRGPTLDGHHFDYGTHTLATTGISEIDHFLLDGIPEADFNLYRGYDSDRSGSFGPDGWNEETCFLDLNDEELEQSVVRWTLGRGPSSDDQNARDALVSLYGQTAAKSFSAVLESVYGQDSTAVGAAAIKLLALHRAAFSKSGHALKNDEFDAVRHIFAHSTKRDFQTAFPPPDTIAIYPKKRGLYQALDFLEAKLSKSGVTILKKCSVRTDGNCFHLDNGEEVLRLDQPRVLWTAGVPSAAKLFLKSVPPKPKAAKVACVANVILKKAIVDLGATYYFVRHPNIMTYRFTNYSQLTGDRSDVSYSLELTVPASFSVDDVKHQVIRELIEMELILDASDIDYFGCSFMPYSFLNMTCDFEDWAETTLLNLSNELELYGPWSSKNLFFTGDCLRDLYNRNLF